MSPHTLSPSLTAHSHAQAEFGPPAELLKDKYGLFTALVDESGDRDALRAIATRATHT